MSLYNILYCFGQIEFIEKEVKIEQKKKLNEGNALKLKIKKKEDKIYENKTLKFINIKDFQRAVK